jgi:LysM repeat protein
MKNWVKLFQRRFLFWALIGSLSAALLAFGLSSPVQAGSGLAAPVMQVPIYTPTPLPDGRIIYIVKLNDSLLSISLITGLSVDELRGMNNLTNDIIFVGQELLLGFGGPAEILITPGPTPTPTAVLPSPTPESGTGNLCILLFNDLNGDSLRQEEEPSLTGGAISINNRAASVSHTVDTEAGFDPHCFDGLAEGKYTISVAVPVGFNPTTNTNYEIELNAGEETYVDFGAQANSETLAEAPILPQEGEKSPILGIIGGLILLAGIGLALFAGRLLKGR